MDGFDLKAAWEAAKFETPEGTVHFHALINAAHHERLQLLAAWKRQDRNGARLHRITLRYLDGLFNAYDEWRFGRPWPAEVAPAKK